MKVKLIQLLKGQLDFIKAKNVRIYFFLGNHNTMSIIFLLFPLYDSLTTTVKELID